jgi:hypothetical protein
MPTREDIAWFKQQFQAQIAPALETTPIGVDLIVAVACQETGHIWSALRRKALPVDQILRLCVGDTLDADRGRRAFPRTKSDLIARPGGQQMFEIARAGLVEMSKRVPGFAGSVANPNKFCHAFGLFQRDLQCFLDDPQYVLEKRYERFDETLARCLGELKRALTKLGLGDRAFLTDGEMAAVGIAYNTGGFKPSKGLKQGHFDGTKFYGEALFDFIRLSQTVALPGEAAPLAAAPAGMAILPPARQPRATGPFFKVDTQTTTLRLRSEPKLSKPPSANVLASLPDGHRVRAVDASPLNGFLEVETSLAGALLRGFASARFLVPDPGAVEIPVVSPSPHPTPGGIPAVAMPRSRASIKRTALANAHSLNEPGRPGRAGTSADELRRELGAIVDWLAVDRPTHKRYQPRAGLTFCNIYSHDYCHLAGAYLPRVWWTPRALVSLAQGRSVDALIGDTIAELRANDLFRWLRDFGPSFGWRQTGTLDKLQTAANQGALGLIVARRNEDGRSGHIVAVVPETEGERARRNASGEVIAPLQSQAGRSNFRYGTSKLDWWKSAEFAESAFWLHA